MAISYRPEIDGLRAIAVLAVIFFHAGFSAFKGGFVGVDVFLVISGYLITRIIVQEHQSGTFYIAKFYERRVRRIIPALVAVVLFTFAVAYFILLPEEMRSFAKSMISASLMVSNFQFLTESDYFDTATQLKPLLHTWSLGIEEQFYVAFPLLLVLLLRYVKSKLSLILFAIGMLSFFYADFISTVSREVNFYLIFSRAWELLAGAGVAFYSVQKNQAANHNAYNLFGLLGLMMIAGCIILLSPAVPYPGRYALIPVMGTVLILRYGTPNSIAVSLLSHRVLVGLGLISYSLYLWHQPVFALSTIQLGELSTLAAILCMLLILGLSFLSWKFVELPFRDKEKISSSKLMMCALTGLLLCIVIGYVGYQSQGFKQRYTPQQIKLLDMLDANKNRGYVFKNMVKLDVFNHPFSKIKHRKLLIVGDSFGGDFTNMVIENHAFKDYEIRTLYIPARCQFYLGKTPINQFIAPNDRHLCEDAQKSLKFLQNNVGQVNVVVMAFSWTEWAAQHISESIKVLHLQPHQSLVVVGTKGFPINKRKILNTQYKDLLKIGTYTPKKISNINLILSQNISPNSFINPQQLVCNSNGSCPLFTPNAEPISSDGGHLTNYGAKYFGKLIVASQVLQPFN